ncbi:uncharacterized protein LOC135847735 isoform X3 [Planococcus citri]|uniref:uncharacterized protein LOC135847735 isoform X3 n=1 Tax=Planococcus citri TaxID=170843 RepID=UPI0031F99349
MAEKTSNSYDVSYSTPVSLQELSVIAVGLELWRSEINEYRKRQKLKEFHDSDKIPASLRSRLPELPSVIYDVIVKYIARLGISIRDWLREHSRTVFYFDESYQSCVLEYFDDFVGNYNGSIDFVKTSERMMHCDSLDDVLKFIVACRYFLEDHVRRIWPSVQEKMDLRDIDLNFYWNPLLYYWMYRLNNQLNKIPTDDYDTVDEVMLEECIRTSHNTLAMNYFWNRVPYESRIRIVIDLFPYSRTECFARSILPRLDLNDQQVIEFVEENGEKLIAELLDRSYHDERLIVQTWMCIRNNMNGIAFAELIVDMLHLRDDIRYVFIGHPEVEHWLHMCCIIWDSAPYHLKRSAIIKISSDLESDACPKNDSIHAASSEFLLYILPHFTLEEKQSFWRNCWKSLIRTKSTRDLQRIMEKCLAREDDMMKFKVNVIADSEFLQIRCVTLLSSANFHELNALVNFSYPYSAESAKNLKRRTLLSSLISDDFYLDYEHVVRCEEFDTFINKAFDSVDLANDFKHQLVSSSNNLSRVLDRVRLPEFSYEALRKFIETFVSTEQILQLVKSSYIDYLKEAAICRSYIIKNANSKPFFDQFLLWCLGSNQLVMEFRQTYITPYL